METSARDYKDLLRTIYRSDPFPKNLMLNIISYVVIGFAFGVLMFYLRGVVHAPIGCPLSGIIWALRHKITAVFQSA